MSLHLTEDKHPVHACEAKDYGSAGIDFDSINTALVHRTSFLLNFGAITGNSILTLYAGASEGTKTTALAFTYRKTTGDFKAASGDLWGADTAVASTGLTLTATTFDHTMVSIEFDSMAMTADQQWLTLSIDATATVLLLGASAVCDPRYQGVAHPTVIK